MAIAAPDGWRRRTAAADGSTLIEDPGTPDEGDPDAQEHPVNELPPEMLRYLLNSRYCEVDRLSNIAVELFGHLKPGWSRVQAICGWVNWKVAFGYHHARSSKTALDVFTERTGVCRDFQHLAVTFCRALNIPARYATGYLGDIGVPSTDADGFQRLVRGLSAKPLVDLRCAPRPAADWTGADGDRPDASDVAITTSFGIANLTGFSVVTDEVSR